ncbi:MAG: MurT ligase domain-containing protein [bacterium]
MSDLRLGAGIAAGRLSALFIRTIGAGGATTMPGRIAASFDPHILASLGGRLRQGTVLITGTNGKTTTARLLSAILERAGRRVVANRAGANLPSGITTALLRRSRVSGRVEGEVGVFEVDEATLPLVAEPLRPRALVLGNLFRDQLDRYGEIDLVADRWRAALAHLHGGTVLYNADDPLVADVARGRAGGRPFGVDDPDLGGATALEHAADGRYCYRCGIPYTYSAVRLGHLGIYRCDRCGTARPPAEVAADAVQMRGAAGATFTLRAPSGRVPIESSLPGLYNVYNVLAAAAAALALGISLEEIAATVAGFRPAFGRGEHMLIDGHRVLMLLAKNPAGFNEVLRTVTAAGEPIVGVIAINDRIADGRDISWLWDVDFELLAGRARAVVLTGLRAPEMAVRLKYAGLDGAAVTLEPDPERAVRLGLSHLAAGETLYVMPTYTAMLALRAALARRGYVRASWED